MGKEREQKVENTQDEDGGDERNHSNVAQRVTRRVPGSACL